MEWYTSDPHYGHQNVIPYAKRPYPILEEAEQYLARRKEDAKNSIPTIVTPAFMDRWNESVALMNQDLITRWNQRVQSHDTVWVLGDFALGKNWVMEVTPKLNGIKKLIPGNHDWCHPVNHKYKADKMEKAYRLYCEVGFEIMPLQVETEIAGQSVLMCHLPPLRGEVAQLARDGTYKIRYEQYRPTGDGWVMHGHTHSRLRVQDKKIHVGVDAWDLRPVAKSEIEDLMRSQDG